MPGANQSLRSRLLAVALDLREIQDGSLSPPLEIVVRGGNGTEVVFRYAAAELAAPAAPETPCTADILAVVCAAGRRLTTSQILTALEQANHLHGESTVKGTLARLVDAGVLTNDPDARPRGYGLPSWDNSDESS
jgi:hypothetical protein